MIDSIKKSSTYQFFSFFRFYRHALFSLSIIFFATFAISFGIGVSPGLTKMLFDKTLITMDIFILYKQIGIAFFLILYLAIFSVIFAVFESNLTTKLDNGIKLTFLDRLSRTNIQFFIDNDAGFIVKRIIEDSYAIADGLCKLCKITANIFMIVAVGFLLYSIGDWIFYLYSLLIISSVLWMLLWIFPAHTNNIRIGAGYSSLYSIYFEIFQGIKEIKISNLEEKFTSKILSANRYLKKNAIINSALNSLLWQFSTLFYFAGYAIILFEGLIRLEHEQITSGMLLGLLSFISYFFDPVQQIYRSISGVQSGVTAAKRIATLKNSSLESTGNFSLDSFNYNVRFENVSLSFGAVNALKNISFQIEKGDKVAFVGKSGSGKSSTINLFLRFYDHYSGRILIDGRDLREFSTSSIRKSIVYVSQDILLFNGSIRNNIDIKSQLSDYELDRIIDLVNLTPLVLSLENGVDTMIGNGGIEFSGGEKQRITIARSLAVNPDIIIFDEITSALDCYNERIIIDNLFVHFKEKTIISVSHRLESIRHCNKYIVFSDGSIVEQGDYKENSELKGEFSTNFNQM